MTPRAWSYGLLFAGILWAALIVAWWLIVAAQTVGVEAWHDSALPQGAFSVVTSRTAPDIAPGQSGVPQGATRDPEPSVGPIATGTPLGDNRGGTPYPSLRAVPRLAAVSRTFAPTGQSMTGTASWMPERYGADYLALPGGPGIRVTICAATCLTMTSNDAGPDLSMQRAGRVADIGVLAWERICGVPRYIGLCQVHMVVIQ